MSPGPFLTAYGLTFLAELPDKTALATVMLAARRDKRAVLAGAMAALALQAGLAASVGGALARLPRAPVRYAAAALFTVLAVKLWLERDEEEEDVPAGAGGRFWPDFRVTFGVIFFAELGDLTQLSTAALAARTAAPLQVFAGAALGLWSVSALAVALGSRLGAALRPALLRKIGAAAFLGAALLLALKG